MYLSNHPPRIERYADGFSYVNHALACGGVLLHELAREYGTPLYVYNLDAIATRLADWIGAFGEMPHIVSYAVKANSSLAVLQRLKREGSSFDVNSRGELHRARAVGIEPQFITMTGVGKSALDIRAALECDILFLNAESLEECIRIDAIATELNVRARVVLRINPDVDAHTHPYIATGLAGHKFGLSVDDALEAIPIITGLQNVTLAGFGMHLGSMIMDSSPYAEACTKLRAFIDSIRPQLRDPLRYINIGGGVGVPYAEQDERVDMHSFIAELRPLLQSFDATIVVEPGRFLVANAGVLVSKVEYVKRTATQTFVILDAGMNDLIRPALYEAVHELQPLRFDPSRQFIEAHVVGPVCETGDTFERERMMREVRAGEMVAFFSAGAYGATMSSRYNSRPFAAEIVISGGTAYLARRRESLDEMLALEARGIPE